MDVVGEHADQGLGVPVGIATFISRSDTLPAAVAVAWAGGQTPPPLAASSPPVKYLPVNRRRSRASSVPSGAPNTPTGKDQGHGSGQHRH